MGAVLGLLPCRLWPFDAGPDHPVATVEVLSREQGPWRWRYLWPRAGRPGGMALLDAAGNTLLWVPGGFAEPGSPPDGRPTPQVAAAMAAAADLEGAAEELERAREALARNRRRAAEAEDFARRAMERLDDGIDQLRHDVLGGDRAPDDDPGGRPAAS